MAEITGEIGFIKHNLIRTISEDVDTVKEIANYEKVGFKGFPAVTVVCSGNENRFSSSAENERTFIFLIRVYHLIDAKAKLDSASDDAKQIAEERLELAVDQIINALDTTKYFTLDGAGDNGVEAIPSKWGYALLAEGWCRVAEIEVRIKRAKIVV